MWRGLRLRCDCTDIDRVGRRSWSRLRSWCHGHVRFCLAAVQDALRATTTARDAVWPTQGKPDIPAFLAIPEPDLNDAKHVMPLKNPVAGAARSVQSFP